MLVVILLVVQYTIILSKRCVKLYLSNKLPSPDFLYVGFVIVENFSKMYADKPAGESVRAMPGKKIHIIHRLALKLLEKKCFSELTFFY